MILYGVFNKGGYLIQESSLGYLALYPTYDKALEALKSFEGGYEIRKNEVKFYAINEE